MAENSFLWTTNGTGDGPSGGYTQAQWAKIAKILASVMGPNGLSDNSLNLFANSLAANQITIQSGQAIVDGKPYENDSNVNVTIPSAVGGGNTRIDRIVLRAVWASQTVRITRIAGTDAASPTVPAVTTTSENTYDIKLYQVRVNTSGTVTIEVDEREWGRLVPKLTKRQGGHATNWNVTGTTTYNLGASKIQVGSFQLTGNSLGDVITFPEAFSAAPLVVACHASTVYSNRTLSVGTETTTTFTAISRDGSAVSQTAVITWIAIGPA